MDDKEIDWDKIQTVDQLKIVVKLICASFGDGSTAKATISKSFFERADEETRKRVEAICKEKNI